MSNTADEKPNEFDCAAAQLWCLPQHGHKEMDVDFAASISTALTQADALGYARGRGEAVTIIMSLLDQDPHQWSKRPCSTCEEISRRIGKDFGCLAYSKSGLSYSEYAKARAISRQAEEKK